MTRSALRCAIGAGFLLTAMASASAQVLEIGTDLSPTGLDPHLVTAFPTFMVVNGNIYEGLTAIDKDLKVTPGLAKSWTVSADGKTYTFKLRPGVKFHDGSAMEADDVVASFKRVQSKEIASPLASRLASIESAKAVDPQTVELKLKEPSAPLLASLATIAIVPSSVETDKDALQKQPVGTGPFKLPGMAAERLHPALASNDALLGKGPAEARRPQVQHRAGIGNPAGRPRQRPIRYPAEHRRGDGFAAQGQAEREARRDARTRLHADRHERVEAALRQRQGPRGAELRAQPRGDRRRGAVRRRRARRAAIAGAEGLGGRCQGVPLLQARSRQGAGAAEGSRRRRCRSR